MWRGSLDEGLRWNLLEDERRVREPIEYTGRMRNDGMRMIEGGRTMSGRIRISRVRRRRMSTDISWGSRVSSG